MKRCLDFMCAALGLLVLAPILFFLMILVGWKLGRPVFFCQVRAGRLGKPFKMFKLRTMTQERNAAGELLPDSARLRPLGRFLRSTSLDELPELWNVLKGDMSLVGPRPLLPDYLPLYTSTQARRHEVRPGITGLAQVSGRNGLSWEERFELDVWYVDNRSTFLDMKILWLTIGKVLFREGISAKGEATMTRFEGSKITPKDIK